MADYTSNPNQKGKLPWKMMFTIIILVLLLVGSLGILTH